MKLADKVMARRVGDETVLLDLASGTYFGLDAVGSEIWELLSRGSLRAEIVEVLATTYDAPRQQIEDDVDRLIAELQSHGLLIE